MHFIPSPFFPAAEDIDIISCIRTCCYNTHHTSLVRPTFRFTEINIARSKLLARFRWSRKTGTQIKGMIAFHHRIAWYPVYTNRIMAGELRIIFGIIQSAIQKKTDTGIGTEHIPFSVKLHWDAISMHVVSFTCIQRNHQAVTRVHTIPLHQPWHIGSIKQRYLLSCWTRH